MKKTHKMKLTNLFLIICTLTTILSSCYRDKLPEPTQEGNNTFGMQVDGKNWLPNNHFSLLGGQKPSADIFIKKGLLRIHVHNILTGDFFEVYVDKVKGIGQYYFTPVSEIRQLFNDSTKNNFIYRCEDSTRFESDGGCESSFKLLDSLNSQMVITKLDTIGDIISGTFKMNLVNNRNEKIEITNGRFDITFYKN